jgi:hypothetical protein
MPSLLNVSGTWTVIDCCYSYALVLNQDQAGNLTGSIYTHPSDLCDDQTQLDGGGQWPVSGAITGSNTFSFAATNPGGGTYDCVSSWQIDATMTSGTTASLAFDLLFDVAPDLTGTMTRSTVPVKLIDPVASGLLDGSAITQNVDAITSVPNPTYVSGAAADGVTQVIVEITQVQAGDSIQLTLVDENGNQGLTAYNGGLFPLGGAPGSASSTLTFQAQGTTAVAVWLAPTNYARGGNFQQDATSIQRALTIQVQDTSASTTGSSGQSTAGSQAINTVRPPVVEIHGLWGSADDWSDLNFRFGVQQSLWTQPALVQTVDYSGAVPVTATTPAYSPNLSQVSGNALGFSYNAPIVLLQLMSRIADYALLYNVAAVQADVIGHSMGGDIARTMAGVSFFNNNNNYGNGYIHKLITIGTPHQGSPLAVDLLPIGNADPNNCVRKILEIFHDVSLQAATVSGVPVNGAVGDLRQGVSGSHPFPIAYIGATTNSGNLSNLDSTGSKSAAIYRTCGTLGGEPLALRLTPPGWNQEFSGADNDAVVALTSQLNGSSSTLIYPGVIHSTGLKDLDFNPPTELALESGIPWELLNLLNEAVNGPDFFSSP